MDPKSLLVTKLPLAVFLCGLVGGEWLSGAPCALDGVSPCVGGKSESMDALSSSDLLCCSASPLLRCELFDAARLRGG
jgi:hypothetical protein